MKRKSNNNNRRSGNSRSSSTTQSLRGGFPDRQRVTLSYVTNISLTPSGVSAADYVFAGNDVFDPDVTSTGSQPANYDDFSAIYQRYRVWGSRIYWNTANSAAGALDLNTVVVGPRHTSTALTTRTQQEYFQAQPYTKCFKTIVYTNGAASVRGSLSMSTQKYFGLSKTQFEGQEDTTALVSTSPAHRWFWHFCITSDDQSSSTLHYVNVRIDYDVEFWDRVDTTLDLRYARLLDIRRAFAVRKSDRKEGKGDQPAAAPPATAQESPSGEDSNLVIVVPPYPSPTTGAVRPVGRRR